jgi:hypothetical protein
MTGQRDPNPADANDLYSRPTAPTEYGRAEGGAVCEAARRAALDVAFDTGAHLTARPAFPGARLSLPDLEPLMGLHASRQVELAARHAARDYVRLAREEGRSWHQIGQALGLEPGTDRDSAGHTVAEAAYNYVAGDPNADCVWPYGRSFAWRCPSCERTIGACHRLQASIAARQTEWEAGQ